MPSHLGGSFIFWNESVLTVALAQSYIMKMSKQQPENILKGPGSSVYIFCLVYIVWRPALRVGESSLQMCST
ncbi:hypothetical protein Q7C36_002637 [Tachysurus vachellii]|uniref:Uncharacterized protein n=1 Tax=Tachysurus vachellii TaxID=175792 RepID=A0AA88NWG4_TACVA|nr:hypothetical protein Q7C36_002637 [Tachysurus vachellii]